MAFFSSRKSRYFLGSSTCKKNIKTFECRVMILVIKPGILFFAISTGLLSIATPLIYQWTGLWSPFFWIGLWVGVCLFFLLASILALLGEQKILTGIFLFFKLLCWAFFCFNDMQVSKFKVEDFLALVGVVNLSLFFLFYFDLRHKTQKNE